MPGLREELASQQKELAGVKASIAGLKSLKTPVEMKSMALEALEETVSELEAIIQNTVNKITEIENKADDPVVFRGRISRQFFYRLKKLPHFGARLRAIREFIEEQTDTRITCQQIADAIGVSNQSISGVENGAHPNPRFQTIHEWCRILGINMDEITDSYYDTTGYARQFGIFYSTENFDKVRKKHYTAHLEESRAN